MVLSSLSNVFFVMVSLCHFDKTSVNIVILAKKKMSFCHFAS